MESYLDNYYPDSAAVILSDKCTAACRECCFGCTPYKNETLSDEEIKSFIDSVSTIPSIKYFVWTGGEAFLLGKRLVKALNYAKEKGYPSRIVTNGYWASNSRVARNRLVELCNAGLGEINLSTGDNHQEFIPIERVLTATLESLRLGIYTCISLETTKFNHFKREDLYQHPIYKRIEDENLTSNLKIINASWISFHKDTKYSYDKLDQSEVENGCNNLFDFIGLNPKNEVVSCCGLTLAYISEMKLGKHAQNLISLIDQQKKDFMKRWLYVAGPVNIIKQVKEWDSSISVPNFVHHCQTCAFIFQEPKIIDCILKNYKIIEVNINKQFLNKIKMNTLINRSER